MLEQKLWEINSYFAFAQVKQFDIHYFEKEIFW